MNSFVNFSYLFFTIIFTVYGQIIIKWQVSKVGELPASFIDKLVFLLKMVFNPWVLSGFVAAFLAALAWMAAMTKFELSYAYPFMGLVFVFLMIFSSVIFNEPMTWQKIIGTGLIVVGVIVIGQG